MNQSSKRDYISLTTSKTMQQEQPQQKKPRDGDGGRGGNGGGAGRRHSGRGNGGGSGRRNANGGRNGDNRGNGGGAGRRHSGRGDGAVRGGTGSGDGGARGGGNGGGAGRRNSGRGNGGGAGRRHAHAARGDDGIGPTNTDNSKHTNDEHENNTEGAGRSGRGGDGRGNGGGGRGGRDGGGRGNNGGRGRRGRGGGGGGGDNANSNLKKLSHSLSWALRHAAIDILHLTMTSDGYVPVDEILKCNHAKFKNVTLEQIQTVVNDNDKQRYSLKELPYSNFYNDESDKTKGSGDKTKPTDTTNEPATPTDEAGSTEKVILCIRANQGHSIKGIIDPDKLLTPLTNEELRALPMIVHGTYKQPYNDSISKNGLSKMNRMHIHFATGLPGHDGVISGMRKTCQIYIFINISKCIEANENSNTNSKIQFYKSDNNVILSSGINDEGIIPTEYFSHVLDASTGQTLLDQR